jgi:hypothetical protein
MKNLIIVAAALVMSASVSAHDLSASSSWSTILSHFAKVIVDKPSVKLDNGPMTSAFFVCKEGDSLRTKKQLTKCVKWDRIGSRDNDRRVCVEETKYFGYAAINGTRERCSQWRTVRRGDDRERICVAYEDVDYTLPLSHQVDVYALTRGGRDNDDRRGRKLFTKTLSIEDCE